MKVVQLTNYGSPYAGSFIPMMDAALRTTRQRGWDPVVVLARRASSQSWVSSFEEQHGAELVFAPDDSGRRLTRWLEDLVDSSPGPTLLHTHFTRFDIRAAALARGRPDVHVIWHFHTVLSDALKIRLRNRLRFRFAGPYVDRMLCVAPHLAAGIRARGAQAEKVEYFPNGVDTGVFPGRADQVERTAARADLGLDHSATVLLHIGRDWYPKGGDLFLDVLERLDGDSVVGVMNRGGETARQEVERRGLEKRVVVLDGTPDVRTLYAASDLMLATSRGEGMPLAVLEALSSGLPVVATDISGHALPGGGPSGFRIAELDPDAIAREARGLLDRPADRTRSDSATSYDWVRDEFGLEAWASRLLAVYEAVTSTRDWGSPRDSGGTPGGSRTP